MAAKNGGKRSWVIKKPRPRLTLPPSSTGLNKHNNNGGEIDLETSGVTSGEGGKGED